MMEDSPVWADAAGRECPCGSKARVGATAMTERIDDAQAREDLERGFHLLCAGKAAEAEAVFSTLLGFPSVAARAAYGSGVAHFTFARENDEAAEVLFSRAVELDPADADAVYYLGCLAERRGDVNEAREQYRRALRINPQHHRARDKLDSRQAEQYTQTTQVGNDRVDNAAKRPSWQDIGRDVLGIGREVLPVVVVLIVLVLAGVVADKILHSVADSALQSKVPMPHLVLAERGARILATWVLAGLGLLIWRPGPPVGRITLLALVIETLHAVISAGSHTAGLGNGGILRSAGWAAGIVLVVFVIWKALTALTAGLHVARPGAAPGPVASAPPVQLQYKVSQHAAPVERNSYVGFVTHLRKGVSYPRRVIAASPRPSAMQDWSFIVELKDHAGQQATGYKSVQLCGSRIKGSLEEGDKVEISRRERESHGILQPRRLRNLSYGIEVTTSRF